MLLHSEGEACGCSVGGSAAACGGTILKWSRKKFSSASEALPLSALGLVLGSLAAGGWCRPWAWPSRLEVPVWLSALCLALCLFGLGAAASVPCWRPASVVCVWLTCGVWLPGTAAAFRSRVYLPFAALS
ncbi:hypothetical protein ATANTOWER_008079 [Ataeniobius toweri]|uniref:Uncharacterized protein n=1 Tax=Ataeniobius toweri TaxID=208326 RepID=A0ABU7B3X5_9TELE|nr:hypothetical protein [Ataeniobius toweri]